jgi:hypothetical protein
METKLSFSIFVSWELAREDEERDRLEDVLAACTYSLN